jgi:hypothetical protein
MATFRPVVQWATLRFRLAGLFKFHSDSFPADVAARRPTYEKRLASDVLCLNKPPKPAVMREISIIAHDEQMPLGQEDGAVVISGAGLP